ncbi:MAG TPA: hypothetical protein VIO64_13515 [Pseudobacteroides sp.]|uniref:hypothetical protein n=1 Tax=Pseudobacteroides sp. TaxID=1968840 RepID=UPI002F920C00
MAIIVFVIFDIIVVAIVLGLLFKFLDIKIPYKLVETVNKSPKLKAALDKIIGFIKDLDLKSKISNLKLPKIELAKRKIKTKPISVNSNDIKQDIANYFSRKKENRSINPDTYDHPKFGRIGNDNEPVMNNNQNDYFQSNNIPSMNQRLATVESSSYSGGFSIESNQKYDNDSSISTKKFTPWALSNNSDDDSCYELLNKKVPEQDSQRVESPYGDRLNQDKSKEEGIKGKLFQRNIKEEVKKVAKEDTKKEKVKKDKSLFGSNKNQNKKYKVVQTGFASIFFSRNNSIIIIPYAKDIEGKGRAMDNIIYIDGPILPHQLGEAVRQAVEIDSNVYPFTDKELVKKLEVKEWCEFTQGRRYISVRYDDECGYILNTTTRNTDGSYRLNCPGGIEKIVNKDATLTDLGDTIYHLLEKCKA